MSRNRFSLLERVGRVFFCKQLAIKIWRKCSLKTPLTQENIYILCNILLLYCTVKFTVPSLPQDVYVPSVPRDVYVPSVPQGVYVPSVPLINVPSVPQDVFVPSGPLINVPSVPQDVYVPSVPQDAHVPSVPQDVPYNSVGGTLLVSCRSGYNLTSGRE